MKTALQQGKFYVFSPYPIEDWVYGRGDQLRWGSKETNVKLLSTREQYASYKRTVAVRGFADLSYNYIYEIKHDLRLFDGSERDCYRLAKAGVVDTAKLGQFLGETPPTDPVELAKFMADSIAKRARYRLSDLLSYIGVSVDGFRKLYDGTYIGAPSDRYPVAFEDLIQAHAVLIDGSVQRLSVPDSTVEFTVPRNVLDELVRYTDNAGKRMKPDAVTWLNENSPKSAKNVYRGFAIQLDDWGDYSKLTIEKVNKTLAARTGIKSLDRIRVGMPLIVKRGKESSWSINAQAAANFTSGMAEASLNFLVKTEATTDRVVIDFTELPRDLKKTFKFQGQGEVILTAGPIKASLNSFWIEDKFNQWLVSHGYEFKPQHGIVKVDSQIDLQKAATTRLGEPMKTSEPVRLPVPVVKQDTEWSCGPAALQAVLSYYDFHVTESELRELTGTTSDLGANPEALAECAASFGFESTAAVVDLRQVQSLLDQGQPVILCVQGYGEGHFAVAHGYTADRLLFTDSYHPKGASYIPYTELDRRWVGDDGRTHLAILIKRK